MAFNNNNAARATAPRNNDESWKAEGFLNIYIPRKNGTRMKLVGAPLRMNNPSQKALYDYLMANPDVAIQTLMAKMIVEFVPVQQGAEDLDL